VRIGRFVNLKGDLFATTFSFGAMAVIKFGSSMILTRILRPADYGVLTVLMSIIFVVEMLADLGVGIFIVRDPKGDDPRYLNTAWTMRLGRAVLNTCVLLIFGPLIAEHFYHAPQLSLPLRVISFWFVLAALESMAFPLAVRRKRSRIIVYSELVTTFIATSFTIVYCSYSRDYWGMIFGTLLSRVLMGTISYFYYPENRPRLQWDRAAATEVLKFTRYTMPSSILTLGLSQFDKVVFLRLFDLNLLGVYGLAGNIAGSVDSLISKISQMVLYPRVAHNFREDPASFTRKYYTENMKLFASVLLLPAAVGGSAHFLITLLYPPRYATAGLVLEAFMLRSALLAFAQPAEDLLIAAGEYQVILMGNVYRAVSLLTGSLVGYFFFGFLGFVYGVALSGLPPLLYYWWLQRSKGFMILRYEAYKVAFFIGVALSSYLASSLLLYLWPAAHIHIRI
jgi:O-antigen/teichoic acid export membrane protein